MREWLKTFLKSDEVALRLDEQRSILHKLAESPACEIIWRTIEKRHPKLEALRAGRIAENCRISIAEAREEARLPYGSVAMDLSTKICHALYPADFGIAATKVQRRALATDAIKAIDILRQCIGKVSPDGDHEQLNEAFSYVAFAETARAIGRLQADGAYNPYGELIHDAKTASLVGSVAYNVASNQSELLNAMRDAFTRWASEPPMIPRPNDSNAGRLRLIRTLTEHFRYEYETPLRAQVLAITGVFFDCNGLAEADIAKLAP